MTNKSEILQFILDSPGTLYLTDIIDICIDPGQSGMLYYRNYS